MMMIVMNGSQLDFLILIWSCEKYPSYMYKY
jgi:hypothetical protein